jgi:hypothetical protein
VVVLGSWITALCTLIIAVVTFISSNKKAKFIAHRKGN